MQVRAVQNSRADGAGGADHDRRAFSGTADIVAIPVLADLAGDFAGGWRGEIGRGAGFDGRARSGISGGSSTAHSSAGDSAATASDGAESLGDALER